MNNQEILNVLKNITIVEAANLPFTYNSDEPMFVLLFKQNEQIDSNGYFPIQSWDDAGVVVVEESTKPVNMELVESIDEIKINTHNGVLAHYFKNGEKWVKYESSSDDSSNDDMEDEE